MALKLVDSCHRTLREVARTVSDFGSRRLEQLVDEMDELRIDSGGIGLAAPQVGIGERIIIVEVPDDDFVGYPNCPAVPPMALINPEIVWESEERVKLPEGCLSLPGLMGNVNRPSQVQVVAQDLDGTEITVFADRWLARVLQHEIDHLDGILYPDRIEDPAELWFVERVELSNPVWSRNPHINELIERRGEADTDETGLA